MRVPMARRAAAAAARAHLLCVRAGGARSAGGGAAAAPIFAKQSQRRHSSSHLCKAKVCDLDAPLARQQQVLGLEVAVDDVEAVQVAERQHNLRRVDHAL
jgi:hypothetical protein